MAQSDRERKEEPREWEEEGGGDRCREQREQKSEGDSNVLVRDAQSWVITQYHLLLSFNWFVL